MTVPREVVGITRWRRRFVLAKAAIFFFWVILLFSQLGLVFAHHEETGGYNSFSARRTRFFNADQSTFHAPPSSSQLVDTEAETPGSNSIYEDDKRIIHTGPNPLHN
ncbi:CLAVATA3/ESR (CLE)-related protein 16 [Melia azedarach]|uniref:CLAVATA3/ESR (CLE)-related protein 16 n=2 Tax=Melia azedarach TaxID=155640 RepID=A0ACC1XEC5_MELAZ|nr:CLAVATA3/ESR (CLE)-related protein 16 [Melia azedarach]KAJ4709745.1 CLAVATA3/ESR (CLE)-related protein 16 [Melia azedarach]